MKKILTRITNWINRIFKKKRMIFINNVDERYFTANGILKPKIYEPLKQGDNSVSIISTLTDRVLIGSENFANWRVDGNAYSNSASLIAALVPVVYLEKNVNITIAGTGGGTGSGTGGLGSEDQTISENREILITANSSLDFVNKNGVSLVKMDGDETSFEVRSLKGFGTGAVEFEAALKLGGLDILTQSAAVFSGSIIQYQNRLYFSDGTDWVDIAASGFINDAPNQVSGTNFSISNANEAVGLFINALGGELLFRGGNDANEAVELYFGDGVFGLRGTAVTDSNIETIGEEALITWGYAQRHYLAGGASSREFIEYNISSSRVLNSDDVIASVAPNAGKKPVLCLNGGTERTLTIPQSFGALYNTVIFQNDATADLRIELAETSETLLGREISSGDKVILIKPGGRATMYVKSTTSYRFDGDYISEVGNSDLNNTPNPTSDGAGNESTDTTVWVPNNGNIVTESVTDTDTGSFAVRGRLTGLGSNYMSYFLDCNAGDKFTISGRIKTTDGANAFIHQWQNIDEGEPTFEAITGSFAPFSYDVTASATGQIEMRFWPATTGAAVGQNVIISTMSINKTN